MEFRDKVSKATDNILQAENGTALAPTQVQLPTDHPRPAVQTFTISQALSTSLRQFAER
jgi:hypothetical protein